MMNGNKSVWQFVKRYPILYLLLGMGVGIGAAAAALYLTYHAPSQDLQLLVLFMSASGSITLLSAYFIFRQATRHWFNSLHWVLWASLLLTIMLVVPNVWFPAQMMFINEHDFYLNLSALLFAGITATTFVAWVVRTITTRLDALSQAAEQLAHGDLAARSTVQGKDEIARLATTFNWMAESLQHLDEQKRLIEQTRRDLIAWVSHDLRTPLTTMRAMLEALADGVITDAETVQRYINNSLTEIANLNALINDLFELAQIDAGHLDMHFTYTSLRDLISDVLSRMNAQAAHRHIVLQGDIQPDLQSVYMAPDKIQRVLYNLIDNAFRYTPEAGAITIRAYQEADYVWVDVHNTGEPIAPEHLPHIFNRFYRGEKSRVRNVDGQRNSGLGLAIARGFIEAHHGMIRVESTAERGTTFKLAFPARPMIG